jgi:hypothetical protein
MNGFRGFSCKPPFITIWDLVVKGSGMPGMQRNVTKSRSKSTQNIVMRGKA